VDSLGLQTNWGLVVFVLYPTSDAKPAAALPDASWSRTHILGYVLKSSRVGGSFSHVRLYAYQIKLERVLVLGRSHESCGLFLMLSTPAMTGFVGDSFVYPHSFLSLEVHSAMSSVLAVLLSVFEGCWGQRSNPDFGALRCYRRNTGPVAGYDLRFERFSFSLYIAPVWPAQRFQRIFVRYSRAFTIMHAPWAALQCDMRLFHSPVPALDG
jgi:hypothetical protein